MWSKRTCVQGRARRGAVALWVAVCLTVMLSVVAIALDGGALQDSRRHVQATADAAALAAAGDLFLTYTDSTPGNEGQDLTGSAGDRARATAAANGYANDGSTSVVTINIPPLSGPFAGQTAHVEVIVQFNHGRNFSNIFTSGTIPVRARAVARGKWAPQNIGILCLDPSGEGALKVRGSAIGVVEGASVVVNSAHSTAAVIGEGTEATLTAQSHEITGGIDLGGGTQLIGPIHLDVPPTPDPLRHLPAPDPNTMPVRSKYDNVVNHGGGYKTYYLSPGRYPGGLMFDGKSSVVMEPGIYYMEGNSEGGGFQFRGTDTTSLKAEGVMLYNARGTNTVTNPDNSAYPQISITGNGSVTWSPPTSGTYKGISFFQERGMDVNLYIAGNGSMNIAGTFYAPDALVQVYGNGVNTIGSRFISYRMDMGGSGTYKVLWNPELLEPVRTIKLVE